MIAETTRDALVILNVGFAASILEGVCLLWAKDKTKHFTAATR